MSFRFFLLCLLLSTNAVADPEPQTQPPAPAAEAAVETQALEAQPSAESSEKTDTPAIEPTDATHDGDKEAVSSVVADVISTPPAPSLPTRFKISLDGHLRAEFVTITPKRFFGVRRTASDTERVSPFVGQNDGFALGDARLNIRAAYGDKLYVRMGFDGALVSYDDAQDTVGRLDTGLKDAYMRYTFSESMVLHAGRFKPPFDAEELTPTEDLYFVHRSLESRGVLRHEGHSGDAVGMAPGRQIGVMIGSDRIWGNDEMSMGYALALTNGNGGDASLNDNDVPAAWLRVSGQWSMADQGDAHTDEEGPATYGTGRGVQVGLSAGYNEVTIGDPPNRQRDRLIYLGLDASAEVSIFRLQGQFLHIITEHFGVPNAPLVHSFGGHAQISVDLFDWGLAPGYRFSLYEPRRATGGLQTTPDFDRVIHHTLGVRYQPADMPLVTLANYTLSQEQGPRGIDNDRFEVAVQVTFR